jgi:hypothetical protein
MSKLALATIQARLDALEKTVLGRPRQRWSKSELAKTEGCSPRQVMRKVDKGLLPPPDEVLNGRLYWWSDSVEDHRKRGTADTPAARAARNPQLRRKPAFRLSGDLTQAPGRVVGGGRERNAQSATPSVGGEVYPLARQDEDESR